MADEPMRLRIGEVAARTGTTTRTIRYYEEIGLLPAAEQRHSGAHRLYDEADVERLADVLRLKELLGVSLDELRELVTHERARAALRSEWRGGGVSVERQREILHESLGHVERQLAVVARRREEITRLERELKDKRRRMHERIAQIDATGRSNDAS